MSISLEQQGQLYGDGSIAKQLFIQQQQMITILKQEILRLQEEVNALNSDKLNLQQQLNMTQQQLQTLSEKFQNVSENNQSLLRTVQVFQREFIKRDSRPPALGQLPNQLNGTGQFNLEVVRTLKNQFNLNKTQTSNKQDRSPFSDFYGYFLADENIQESAVNLYQDLIEGKRLRSSKLKSVCKKSFFHESFRHVFWYNAIQNKQKINQRLYKCLLEIHANRQENTPPQGTIIDLDLRRMDLKLDDEKSKKVGLQIKKLLQMFQIYRPDIRYVQGMSYLAWILLIRLPPFWAFSCFCNLILSDPFVHSLYLFQEVNIRSIIDFFWVCLEDRRPKLYKHMRQLQVDCELFLIQWAYTLYSRTFSLRIVSKIWDSWFSEGYNVFFKVALTILQISESVLLQQKESDQFNDTLRNRCFKIEEAEFIRILSKQKLTQQLKLQ